MKFLVPYREDSKLGNSSENQDGQAELDNSKFVNSFTEPKYMDTNRPLLRLGNNSQVAQLSKLNADHEVNANDDEKKRDCQLHYLAIDNASDFPPLVSSRWDKEDVPTNVEESAIDLASRDEQKPPIAVHQDSSSGPQNVLRRALDNMQKDNNARKKKAKSKKIRKMETDDSGSDLKKEKSKNAKKKRKEELKIPGKMLKKLMKKNLLKKKALESLIYSGEYKKKRRKNKNSDDEDQTVKPRRSSDKRTSKKSERSVGVKSETISRNRSSQRSIENRRTSPRNEKREVSKQGKLMDRKGSKKDDKEEREVKSSKEGNIQVRLANSSLQRDVNVNKPSLADTIRANLLKMAGQVNIDLEKQEKDWDRNSPPPRRSVKDRLGPRRGESSRGNSKNLSTMAVERVLGRAVLHRLGVEKKDEEHWREGGKSDVTKDGPISVPAGLQAWADNATLHRERVRSAVNSHSEDDLKDSRRNRTSYQDERNKERRRVNSRGRSSSREKRRENKDRKHLPVKSRGSRR